MAQMSMPLSPGGGFPLKLAQRWCRGRDLSIGRSRSKGYMNPTQILLSRIQGDKRR